MRALIISFALLAVVAPEAGRIQPDAVYRETEVRQARPRLEGEVFDPQESDPALRDTFARVDRKAERAVGNVTRDSRFITEFWRVKKRILRKKYGIEWKTPAELNPNIAYANYGQPQVTAAEDRALRSLVVARLSASSEVIVGIDRSFEGVVRVWTRDPQADQSRLYRFAGHDESWTFIDVAELCAYP